MKLTTLTVRGCDYVVLPRDEYDHLVERAGQTKLPPLPKRDRRGSVPAIEYVRASRARSIITARVRAGLSREKLAELAGVRVQTLERIESGEHRTNISTLDKLDFVLRRRLEGRNGRRRT